MAEREAWIIDGVRTPRGKGKADGGLHGIHPQALLAQCLNAMAGRAGIDRGAVDDVIIGNASNTGDHGDCIARQSLLAAGWPIDVPGVTLNRFCGSGQTAVSMAAMGVLSGMQDLVVGGGVESMSRPGPRVEGQGPSVLNGHNEELHQRYATVPQGISADLIATLEGFTREQCDELAVRSQDRAAKAIAEGRFGQSVIAVTGPDGELVLDHEEHPRPGTTVESLGGLKPSFAAMGQHQFDEWDETFDQMCLRTYPELDDLRHVHHAGNSSGVVDGAGVVLIASSDFARAHGLTPRARIRMTTVAGSEPVVMLTAPGPASRKCLSKAGMTIDDIDLWEINEAFAVVLLKVERDLDLDPAKINVNGGAMALGHPIGATGAMLIQTAVDELERSDQQTALVTMCTGGGMGTATIIERV